MNKEQYLELRNGLYTEAENLINEGKLEESQTKMQEITELDNKYENEAKALANLNALKDNNRITNLVNLSNNNIKGTVIDTFGADKNEDFSNTIEYRKAFMNYVTKGTAIPGEFKNAAGPTKTSDVGEMGSRGSNFRETKENYWIYYFCIS